MRKMIFALAASTAALSGAAFGQAETAMQMALRLKVCTGNPVSATTLATGQLQVTCPRGQVNPQYASNVVQPAALGGTALTPAAGAALLGAAVLVVVAGDSSDSTTTTPGT